MVVASILIIMKVGLFWEFHHQDIINRIN